MSMPRSSTRRAGSGPVRRDELLQVLALDVLEDDVLAPVGLAAVDDGDDVRVGEPRDGARLAAEPLDVLRIVREALVQDLDRDQPAELAVARPVDARHAARAAQLLQLVPPREQLADHAH